MGRNTYLGLGKNTQKCEKGLVRPFIAISLDAEQAPPTAEAEGPSGPFYLMKEMVSWKNIFR
jgi:hypothetical protein